MEHSEKIRKKNKFQTKNISARALSIQCKGILVISSVPNSNRFKKKEKKKEKIKRKETAQN
jgi:hypothetical protein